jgi:hypothetical protein
MTDVVLIAIVAAVPASLAAVVSLFNRNKLSQVETRMDGRLDELLIISKAQSYTLGKAAGKIEEKDENDIRQK